MLLIDVNQVFIANIMMEFSRNPQTPLNEDLIRHMVLNSLRSYVKAYRSYGEVVICCDNQTYWRKDYFPFYKSQRKIDRQTSKFDWKLIFDTIYKITQEIKVNFPYKVLNVEGAEADDIIAVIVKHIAASSQEPVLILSADKDFVQLQKYPFVKQYSPILNKYLETNDPYKYIKEHIIRGDRGDGIPNILSNDNIFSIGGRQTPISSKKLENWLTEVPSKFCTSQQMLRNYTRNQKLVDFDHIPFEIEERIVLAYETAVVPNRINLIKYFMEHKLKNLMESITDF
jgi:hypothetical protein